MNDFYGFPTRRLSSDSLELECLVTAGPRIVRLSYKGSPNLLAEVPNISVPTPYGDFHYLGGHRLWHAPESMPGSYIPDDKGLSVSELPDGLLLDGTTETLTGIRKRIEIRLDPHEAKVTLDHTLINDAPAEVELAPWALTMFRLGGTAILPLRLAPDPSDSLLPDRHLSLWPYSHIRDARLQVEDEFVLVTAQPDMPPFKIGAMDPAGWMAYWFDGVLFRKTFAVNPGLPHPDYDCNAEIYCDDQFIELESLGPLAKLAPGGSVTFRETWELFDRLEPQFISQRMIELLAAKRPE